MRCLQTSGVPIPWGIWGLELLMGLQNAASWVWAKGGDFVSADGRQVLLDRPEACEGLLAYLRLSRYMPPEVKRVEGLDAFGLFAKRQVAVVMGASGWLPAFYEQSTNSDIMAHLGVATPPGPAFVGGSALIVWRHSRHANHAVNLIRFLVDRPVPIDCFLASGLTDNLAIAQIEKRQGRCPTDGTKMPLFREAGLFLGHFGRCFPHQLLAPVLIVRLSKCGQR